MRSKIFVYIFAFWELFLTTPSFAMPVEEIRPVLDKLLREQSRLINKKDTHSLRFQELAIQIDALLHYIESKFSTEVSSIHYTKKDYERALKALQDKISKEKLSTVVRPKSIQDLTRVVFAFQSDLTKFSKNFVKTPFTPYKLIDDPKRGKQLGEISCIEERSSAEPIALAEDQFLLEDLGVSFAPEREKPKVIKKFDTIDPSLSLAMRESYDSMRESYRNLIKPDRPPMKLNRPQFKAKLNGKSLILDQFYMPPDGDCALSALQITRKDFINKLEQAVNDERGKHEKPFTSFIRANIQSNPDVPEKIRNQYSLDTDNAVTVEGQTVKGRNDYIKDVLSKSTYFFNSHDIEIAANLFGFDVQIWKQADNGSLRAGHRLMQGTLNEPKSAGPGGAEVDRPTRHLLYDGHIHYDALAPREDHLTQRALLKKEARTQEMQEESVERNLSDMRLKSKLQPHPNPKEKVPFTESVSAPSKKKPSVFPSKIEEKGKRPEQLDLTETNAGTGLTQYDYRTSEGSEEGRVACNFHAMESIFHVGAHMLEVENAFDHQDTQYFGKMRRAIMDQGIEARDLARRKGMPNTYLALPDLNHALPLELQTKYASFGLTTRGRSATAIPNQDIRTAMGAKTLEEFRTEIQNEFLVPPPQKGKVRYMLLSPNGETISFVRLDSGQGFIFDSHRKRVVKTDAEGLFNYVISVSGSKENLKTHAFDYYIGEVPVDPTSKK